MKYMLDHFCMFVFSWKIEIFLSLEAENKKDIEKFAGVYSMKMGKIFFILN